VSDHSNITLPRLDDADLPFDPYRRICEIVREALPADAAEPLLERIGDALAHVVPGSWDLLALENARLRQELEQAAVTDELTGLRNRHRFFEDLRREFAAARRYGDPLSLLLLDVDGLKHVNENRGFEAGDTLLLALSDLLMTKIRITDIAARIGDDDFAVILPRTPLAGGRRLAERLADALGGWVHIGVAAIDAGVSSSGELLELADRDLEQRRQGAQSA
jgi:diguanylate cyclase (GGDEF)-like protein